MHLKSSLLCDVTASNVRADVKKELRRSKYLGIVTWDILVLINVMHNLDKTVFQIFIASEFQSHLDLTENISYTTYRCVPVCLSLPVWEEKCLVYNLISIHTVKKRKISFLVDSAMVSVEVNAEKTKYVFMSCEQNGEHHNINLDTFESVTKV